MSDNHATTLAASHEMVWELIPWYVNGTLSRAEKAAVESHCRECEACSVEIERQRGLAEGVAALEPVETSVSRNFEALRVQIESEKRALRPARSIWDALPNFNRGFAVAGTLAAVLLVAVIAQQPADEGFQTLTNNGQADTIGIKFQTAPDVDQATLTRILAERGLILDGGPSEAGVYRAVAAAGIDLDAMADALTALPEIAFAASEAPE